MTQANLSHFVERPRVKQTNALDDIGGGSSHGLCRWEDTAG